MLQFQPASHQRDIARLDEITAAITALEQERTYLLALPPKIHHLPRDIRVHYVPIDNGPNSSPCKLKAINGFEFDREMFVAGTPYTIKGVWGCSHNSRQPMSTSMRVHITIDQWYDYVVAGKDLLP